MKTLFSAVKKEYQGLKKGSRTLQLLLNPNFASLIRQTGQLNNNNKATATVCLYIRVRKIAADKKKKSVCTVTTGIMVTWSSGSHKKKKQRLEIQHDTRSQVESKIHKEVYDATHTYTMMVLMTMS